MAHAAPAVGELIERHTAFYQRREMQRPLLLDGRSQPYSVSVGAMYADCDGRPIRPEDADAERYLAAINWSAAWEPGDGDLFAMLVANPRIPWMEAIAGARVVPQVASDSVWSDRPERAVAGTRAIRADEDWLNALLAHLDRVIEASAGRMPVSQTLMRGPGDVLEALMGAEALLYAMADDADWLRALIGSATNLFVRVARLQWERIPRWHGGYVNYFGFWSPAPCVRAQEDVQRILSPELYREWLRPALCKIVAAFPHSVFHMHSGSLHLAEEAASVPRLSALQVSVDPLPYAPPIADSMRTLRAVQEHVPLFIEGPLTDAELHALRRGLSPRGLAIRRDRPR